MSNLLALVELTQMIAVGDRHVKITEEILVFYNAPESRYWW